jgi:drug/metabolite transporter (DMT)-like permease
MARRPWLPARDRPGAGNALLAAVLFGASAPAASVLVDDTSPLLLAGLLYLGAAIAVAPWALRSPPPAHTIRRSWPLVAVAIVAGGIVGPALLTWGLVSTPASTASLLLNTELVFTVLLAATLFREHLGRRMIGAVSLVVLAGVLLVWEPGGSWSWRALAIVGACACWGLDNGATARIDQLRPQHVTFVKGIVAGVVNITLGLLVGGTTTAVGVSGALVVGALGYGASITLWVRGAQQLGASRAQVLFALAPFLGALISWTLLGDELTVTQMVAMVIAAVGVALSLDTAHEHTHVHEHLVHTHEHRHDDGHHDHRHDPPVVGTHTHEHEHEPMAHAHPHVPDVHHRHVH